MTISSNLFDDPTWIHALVNGDPYGRVGYTADHISKLLYVDPDLDLKTFDGTSGIVQYNKSVIDTFSDFDHIRLFPLLLTKTVKEFDNDNQSNWYMPDKYKTMDITQIIWESRKTDSVEEKERISSELVLFEQKNLLPMLNYLKYLVDTMREHKIVWGVGRGSSVASYVLFLIGVHKIDALKFQLPIEEFLR